MDSHAAVQLFFNVAYVLVAAAYIVMLLVLFMQYKRYAGGKLFRPYFRMSVMFESVVMVYVMITIGLVDFFSVGIGVRSPIILWTAAAFSIALAGLCVFRTVRTAIAGIYLQIKRFDAQVRTRNATSDEPVPDGPVLVPSLPKVRVDDLDTDDTLVD